jgi:hypothetical protein
VGGLLALFKIGMLMKYVHRQKFLRGLAVDLSKHEHGHGDSFDSDDDVEKGQRDPT